MRRRLLESTVHQATLTEADLTYVGAISLDPTSRGAADNIEHEPRLEPARR